MHEEIPKILTPEQLRRQEDDALLEQYMKDNPDKFEVIAPENRRECRPEIVELESMLDLFESTYPLERLNAIVEFPEEELKAVGEPPYVIRKDGAVAVNKGMLLALVDRATNQIEPYDVAAIFSELKKMMGGYNRRLDEFKRKNPDFLFRESAKEDLVPIHNLFRKIKKETNISLEEEEELEKRRSKLSMAVGFVNCGKIRHKHNK